MAKVNRETLLRTLESVRPGLSQRDLLEQSASFVFKGGRVYTFNDEISCSAPSGLPKDIEGAVPHKKFLEQLSKWAEEEVDITPTENELLITGKGSRRCGVRKDSEIALPLDVVEKPREWRELPENFADAISIVSQAASSDQSDFINTCVHVAPKWIEATDRFQICRYRIKTGFQTSLLARRDSIKWVGTSSVTEVSETDNWVHFRNAAGLVLSCRRFSEEFTEMGDAIKSADGGTPLTLPPNLAEAADKAAVFSSDNADDDKVMVELIPGKMKIVGNGISGWYRETKKCTYSGPKLSFLISPKLLTEITKKHNDVFVTNNRLRVDGERWVFIACLGVPDENSEPEETTDEAPKLDTKPKKREKVKAAE